MVSGILPPILSNRFACRHCTISPAPAAGARHISPGRAYTCWWKQPDRR